jgi:hypothetical protein
MAFFSSTTLYTFGIRGNLPPNANRSLLSLQYLFIRSYKLQHPLQIFSLPYSSLTYIFLYHRYLVSPISSHNHSPVHNFPLLSLYLLSFNERRSDIFNCSAVKYLAKYFVSQSLNLLPTCSQQVSRLFIFNLSHSDTHHSR